MKYSTNNVQTSLTIEFSRHLRSQGYDVYWQSAGVTDAQTAGLTTSKAVITLVPDFPADPTYVLPANPTNVQRLKTGGLNAEEVVVPALSLQVLGSPSRGDIIGLGSKEYNWVREIRIDGLAADQFQHRALADLLHEWFNSEERKAISVYNYDDDPVTPPLLEPVEVLHSATERQELISEVDAVRYYVRTLTRITYVE